MNDTVRMERLLKRNSTLLRHIGKQDQALRHAEDIIKLLKGTLHSTNKRLDILLEFVGIDNEEEYENDKEEDETTDD